MDLGLSTSRDGSQARARAMMGAVFDHGSWPSRSRDRSQLLAGLLASPIIIEHE